MIELLVVIGVMSLLTSMLVVYNRDSERLLVLFKEQAKLTNAVLRARAWSIQTLRGDTGSPSCGYGVHFSLPDTYTIFRIPKAGTCNSDDNNQMNPNGVAVEREEVVLPSGIVLQTNLTDVFFAPPDPKTFLTTGGPAAGNEEIVSLCTTTTPESCSDIAITRTGQVFSRR